MLSLENNLQVLKMIIGKRVNEITSSHFHFIKNELVFMERKLILSTNERFHLVFNSSFFESDAGEIFHDYTLESAEFENGSETMSKFHLGSSLITKIEIYGRQFPLEEFKAYQEIHDKYKSVDRIDNVLVFYENEEQSFAVVFHDYFPSINVYLGQEAKETFFHGSLQKYSLHYEIK